LTGQHGNRRGGHQQAQGNLSGIGRRCSRSTVSDEIDDAPNRHTRARDHREPQRPPRLPDEHEAGQTEQEPSGSSHQDQFHRRTRRSQRRDRGEDQARE